MPFGITVSASLVHPVLLAVIRCVLLKRSCALRVALVGLTRRSARTRQQRRARELGY